MKTRLAMIAIGFVLSAPRIALAARSYGPSAQRLQRSPALSPADVARLQQMNQTVGEMIRTTAGMVASSRQMVKDVRQVAQQQKNITGEINKTLAALRRAFPTYQATTAALVHPQGKNGKARVGHVVKVMQGKKQVGTDIVYSDGKVTTLLPMGPDGGGYQYQEIEVRPGKKPRTVGFYTFDGDPTHPGALKTIHLRMGAIKGKNEGTMWERYQVDGSRYKRDYVVGWADGSETTRVTGKIAGKQTALAAISRTLGEVGPKIKSIDYRAPVIDAATRTRTGGAYCSVVVGSNTYNAVLWRKGGNGLVDAELAPGQGALAHAGHSVAVPVKRDYIGSVAATGLQFRAGGKSEHLWVIKGNKGRQDMALFEVAKDLRPGQQMLAYPFAGKSFDLPVSATVIGK